MLKESFCLYATHDEFSVRRELSCKKGDARDGFVVRLEPRASKVLESVVLIGTCSFRNFKFWDELVRTLGEP